MKIKITISTIISMFIILLASSVFAVTGNVELNSSVNEIRKGEVFTVTLSATSNDGINGIDTKYIYDSEKLELIEEKVSDGSKWSNLGNFPEVTIICNSTQSIKNSDIHILKFKVKNNVSVGSKIKVETTEILLDTDAQENSQLTIQPKKVEITVKADSNEDNNSNQDNNSNTDNSNSNQNNSNSNQDNNNSNTNNNNSNQNDNSNTDNNSSNQNNNSNTNNNNSNTNNNSSNSEQNKSNTSNSSTGTNNNSTSKSSTESKQTTTVAKSNDTSSNTTSTAKTLPKAGGNLVVVISIIILTITSIVLFAKNIQYKGIK